MVLNEQQLLQCPERADTRTKDPAEEEGKQQRQAEEEEHRQRQHVAVIRQRQRHVLDAADAAHAPLAEEAEVAHGEQGDEDDLPAALSLDDRPRHDAHQQHEHQQVDRCPERLVGHRIGDVGILIARFKVGLGEAVGCHTSGAILSGYTDGSRVRG
ncbi:MAG: hypothetical protein LBN06_03940 [Prevotellaceae bacterium]|nr:hypothetical protein [Prevotellaceae bacterium]